MILSDIARLPAPVEEFLLDVALDHSSRDHRRVLLGFCEDVQMRDAFLKALTSPGLRVHADVCEDDPNEIVVRAQGVSASGVSWGPCNIILLEPTWMDGTVSQDLAEDIVEHWERLQQIATAVALAA